MHQLCKPIKFFIYCIAFAVLTSCATGPSFMLHGFSFNTFKDSPDIEVLDYSYGNRDESAKKGLVGISADASRVKAGQSLVDTNVFGGYPKGDYLYVRWRIKDTGKVFEDTVDLRSRLPTDINNFGIRFVVMREQLYVYLVPPPGIFQSSYLKNAKTNPVQAEWLHKAQIYPNK